MKNLPSIIRNGNLTAHERYLMLVQDDALKSKTGSGVLTAADRDALENWHATDNNEAREWNRLNDGWKHMGRMEIEAEFVYKDAHIDHLYQLPIILKLATYSFNRELRGSLKTLKLLKKTSVDEATRIATKQREVKLKDGMDLDYAVYQLAFEHLTPEDKKKMNGLYPDIETDHQYLDQEEIISNLSSKGEGLTPEAREKLSELVAEHGYNKFAKEYQLFHYFACIPLIEVAKYFLKDHGIEIMSKALVQGKEVEEEYSNPCDNITKAMGVYATDHGTTVQNMLKEACLKNLDELLERYKPLAMSNEAELLQRWLSGKIEAATLIHKHIDAGELKIQGRTKEETVRNKLYSKGLYDNELEIARQVLEYSGREMGAKDEIEEKRVFETFNGVIITGDSLYTLKESYDFVKKFRERVDEYEPNLGIVYADDDPEQKGGHLDREFLICGLDDKGEASFFSLFGMSTSMLSIVIEADSFFNEVAEGDTKYLVFKNAKIEEAFRMRRSELIADYAKLLAFEGILKKLEKIYEADLTWHIADRIKMIRGYMESNNDAVREATNTNENKPKKKGDWLFRRKDVLKIKEPLLIDVDAIKPDTKYVEEHELKFREIFGHF